MTWYPASQRSTTLTAGPPRRLVPVLRGGLAAGLRTLPLLFGDRGRRHATWRAHYWAPEWLHEGGTHIRVRRAGLRWHLDLRDNVQKSLYYTGSYEPEVQALLRQAVPAGGVYVDAGAHIGVHAVLMARHLASSGGRVIAFEPAPDNLEKMRAVAADAAISNLTTVGLALGDSASTIALRANDHFGEHDTGVRSRFGGGAAAYEVPMERFDRWEEHHRLGRLDAVKIDVEGSELQVLVGMEGALRRYRPALVVVELLEENCRAAGIEVDDIRGFLAEVGYVQRPNIVEKNAIFVPKEPLS